MKKLILLLTLCIALTACGKKDGYIEPTQPEISSGFTHKSTITGRSCVDGFSMIRIDFTGNSSSIHDYGVWVYEIKKDSSSMKVSC